MKSFIICNLHHIKEDEIAGHVAHLEELRNAYLVFFFENLEGLHIDGRVWAGLNWLRIGSGCQSLVYTVMNLWFT
jgi:hypothetical protein